MNFHEVVTEGILTLGIINVTVSVEWFTLYNLINKTETDILKEKEGKTDSEVWEEKNREGKKSQIQTLWKVKESL